MEKAIVVLLDVAKVFKHREEACADALGELNRHLAEGWCVKHASPMEMGGLEIQRAISLVVLERDD